MKDADGEVLYVGKAKMIKRRVASYFRNNLPSPWIRIMVSRIENIETIVVGNEFEALLLENNLIKKYHPNYNILLKDDKTFPFLKLTNEEFPRIMIVRKVANDKARYFGPYLSAYALRQSIQFIRKNFGIVTHTYKKGQRACLDYQLGLCAAPYAGKTTPAEYQKRVDLTIEFLKGNFKELRLELEKKMKSESEAMEFEAAAKTRDQLSNLDRMVATQNIVSTKMVNQDVIGVYKLYSLATCTIMKIRGGKLLGSRTLEFKDVADFSEGDILEAVLSQHYIHNMDLPREILISHEVEDLSLINDAFLENKKKTKILVPKLGEKRNLIQLALENCMNKANLILNRSKISEQILDSLQNDLKLMKRPVRIEAYDISNLGANQAVGAMVTFVGGIPEKNSYRKFIIRSVEGQNDFAMMSEVLRRRVGLSKSSKVSNNKVLPKPDLILIDGGKGQLNAAYKVLKSLGWEKVQIIGLAKKFELIYKPGIDLPLALSMEAKSLLLLRAIRDEVHRFGITFHRLRRGKDFIK